MASFKNISFFAVVVLLVLSFAALSQEHGADNKKPVYIGVIPRDNPRIAYEKYQPIVDYLTIFTPHDFELVLEKTYKDTVNALGAGKIDFAFLGPLTYLHAHVEFEAYPFLKSITAEGESLYRSVIVAKDSVDIQHVSDLSGKSIAFGAFQSTSGNLLPRYLLADHGIHIKELGSYKHFNSQDSVAKWVLKGKYDAGAVRESIAKKYMPLGLKIISESMPIPTGPIVAGKRTAAPLIQTVKDALLSLNVTNEGRTVLAKVDSDIRGGFAEAADEDYEQIRKLVNNIPTGCGMACHPKIKL